MAETLQSLKRQVTKLKNENAKLKSELTKAKKSQVDEDAVKTKLISKSLVFLNDQTFNWSDFKANPESMLVHLFG
jgi:cell shape-determining protein MreC